MKVFISGPMSGKPNDNRAAFYKAQEELEKHGYSVWNPAWLAYPNNTEFTKDDMHIIDFAALRRCDAIYMLKGWKHSKGAQEEHEYAIIRGLMIMYEGPCCWGKEPVFDREFALDEEIKNRTNYQFEAIKGNIRAKYAELKNITENLDISIGNESDRINSLEGEVEAIKESIGTDNLQEQLEKDFADVYEEFQNTKDQVNDINMGYIKWSSEVSQFDERIEKLEENMKEIAANGGLRLSFNLMNERVSSNKRDISSLRNDIDHIRNWINIHDRAHREELKQMSDLGSELDEYIDDYKEAYKHLDNADEALERRIKALEKRSDDCTKRMNLFSREIETYEEAYKQLRTSLDNNDNALEKRIKAIEKRLNIKPFYEPTDDEKDDD